MKKRILSSVALCSLMALTACQTSAPHFSPFGGPGSQSEELTYEHSDTPVIGQSAPGSVFAPLRPGMSYGEVIRLIGKPTTENIRLTGNGWKATSANEDRWRHYLSYKGVGLLVFAGVAGGNMSDIARNKDYVAGKLIYIVHNPAEGS